MEIPTNKNNPSNRIKISRKLEMIKLYLTKYVLCNVTKIIYRSAGVTWMHAQTNNNKLIHALNGNKKIGYKVAAWNCRKGLLKPDGLKWQTFNCTFRNTIWTFLALLKVT